MKISECKIIVHSFFDEDNKYLEHLDNKQLQLNKIKYRIQPDDTYIFKTKVIAIEYEKTKRPVESISKYWWLFTRTDWLEHAILLKTAILILNPKPNLIREDSLKILGEELALEYPKYFEFFYLPYNKIDKDNIRNLLIRL